MPGTAPCARALLLTRGKGVIVASVLRHVRRRGAAKAAGRVRLHSTATAVLCCLSAQTSRIKGYLLKHDAHANFLNCALLAAAQCCEKSAQLRQSLRVHQCHQLPTVCTSACTTATLTVQTACAIHSMSNTATRVLSSWPAS